LWPFKHGALLACFLLLFDSICFMLLHQHAVL
jgi:hypothetical protein